MNKKVQDSQPQKDENTIKTEKKQMIDESQKENKEKSEKEMSSDATIAIKTLKENEQKWQKQYMRALADYENLERRAYEERLTFQKKATKNLLIQFLDVLDNIEKASIFITDKGMQLVKEKFVKILTEEGVSELEVMGKAFDPYIAECLEVVVGKKDNIVVEVVRKGYALHGNIIRPALVKVEKQSA